MRKSKWTYGIIVILILAAAIFWRFDSTKERRAQEAEIQALIKFAQRQALEIAVIEQASKLTDYKRQMMANQTKPVPKDSK